MPCVSYRPGKALKQKRQYFKRNGGRGGMDYARIAALKLPIGSGAIESAIRRVVNLRLKGPSTTGARRLRRPFCCYVRTTRRDAGIILRGRRLQAQQGSPREPKEMDRSPVTLLTVGWVNQPHRARSEILKVDRLRSLDFSVVEPIEIHDHVAGPVRRGRPSVSCSASTT